MYTPAPVRLSTAQMTSAVKSFSPRCTGSPNRTSTARLHPSTCTANFGGRMRAYVQVLGGVVLSPGLASAVGLDPSVLFAVRDRPRRRTDPGRRTADPTARTG